jgi:hypothetical protein
MGLPKTIKNQTIAKPRLTKQGYWALCCYLILPLLGVLAATDILFYLLFRYVYGMCYGVMCWF